MGMSSSVESSVPVVIKNIHPAETIESISQLLAMHKLQGEKIRVNVDEKFVLVEVRNEKEAQNFIQQLNGKRFNGRILDVEKEDVSLTQKQQSQLQNLQEECNQQSVILENHIKSKPQQSQQQESLRVSFSFREPVESSTTAVLPSIHPELFLDQVNNALQAHEDEDYFHIEEVKVIEGLITVNGGTLVGDSKHPEFLCSVVLGSLLGALGGAIGGGIGASIGSLVDAFAGDPRNQLLQPLNEVGAGICASVLFSLFTQAGSTIGETIAGPIGGFLLGALGGVIGAAIGAAVGSSIGGAAGEVVYGVLGAFYSDPNLHVRTMASVGFTVGTMSGAAGGSWVGVFVGTAVGSITYRILQTWLFASLLVPQYQRFLLPHFEACYPPQYYQLVSKQIQIADVNVKTKLRTEYLQKSNNVSDDEDYDEIPEPPKNQSETQSEEHSEEEIVIEPISRIENQIFSKSLSGKLNKKRKLPSGILPVRYRNNELEILLRVEDNYKNLQKELNILRRGNERKTNSYKIISKINSSPFYLTQSHQITIGQKEKFIIHLKPTPLEDSEQFSKEFNSTRGSLFSIGEDKLMWVSFEQFVDNKKYFGRENLILREFNCSQFLEKIITNETIELSILKLTRPFIDHKIKVYDPL